jgi:hypothetical protein
MQFNAIIASLFAAGALGAAVAPRQVPYIPCSGLTSNAQCCATDVLGVADLDCGVPQTVPTSADNFSAICATIGQRARCCAIPIVSLLQSHR